MAHDALIEQHHNIIHDFPSYGEVQFDPEQLTIIGLYQDELSAHRAKRGWQAALTQSFLLDAKDDVSFATLHDPTKENYVLRCHFESACARYAFWRLVNAQAPEAQYAIETAHIPVCESRHADFMAAPDMRPVGQANSLLGRVIDSITDNSAILRSIRRVLQSSRKDPEQE